MIYSYVKVNVHVLYTIAVADPGFWFGGGTFSHKLSTKNFENLKKFKHKFCMKI